MTTRLPVVVATLVGMVTMGPNAAFAGPPPAYSAAEIRGTVVDADTKRPLEGVHVVAQWIAYTVASPLQMHRGIGTPLQIMETLTNAEGRYLFPAWGPKPRPTFSRLEWGADPRLTFFRPGYRVLSRSNYSPPPENEEEMAVRISRWHGRTVALQPFRGTAEDWVQQLQLVQGRLAWADATDDPIPKLNDYWKHFPLIVLAVLDQRRILPVELRHRVSDLESWGATEEAVRKRLKRNGEQ